jgi:hypothetical protein
MIINYIPINKLVEFRKLSERRQSTFVNNLKIPKKPKTDDEESNGGNYWQRCLSGVSTAFKQNDNGIIKERIDSLLEVYEKNDDNKVRTMYQRNLHILQKYEDFDFSTWPYSSSFKFLSKTKTPLTIKDVPIRVIPQHVFTYGNKSTKSIGGIFFVASVKGYKSDDLGIFSEAIFRYLTDQHPEGYYIDPNYCYTVDASTMHTVSYQQVLDGKIPSLLQSTIDTLKKFL